MHHIIPAIVDLGNLRMSLFHFGFVARLWMAINGQNKEKMKYKKAKLRETIQTLQHLWISMRKRGKWLAVGFIETG